MGILIIDDRVKQEVADAVQRARAKPISFEILKAGAIPDAAVVTLEDRPPDLKRPQSENVIIGSYRVAISFEEQPAGLCRHISVSTLAPATVPPRIVCEQIAALFGITRPPSEGHIWLEEFEPGHFAVNFLLLEQASN